MTNILKRFYCKYKHQIPVNTLLVETGENRYRTMHIWKCTDCGKTMKGK